MDVDGSLHVRQDQTQELSDKYLLTIRVSNPDDPRYSEQHFRVLVLDVDKDTDDDDDEIHHRFRRAAVADAVWINNAVSMYVDLKVGLNKCNQFMEREV